MGTTTTPSRSARSIGRVLFLLLLLAGSPAALLCRGRQTISGAEADVHVGEEGTVCDRVASSRYVPWARGEPTFLNFGRPYPNQVFTVVIWGNARGRFDEPPEERFQGLQICVTGTIKRYRGKPEIVVEWPRQIEVVETGER